MGFINIDCQEIYLRRPWVTSFTRPKVEGASPSVAEHNVTQLTWLEALPDVVVGRQTGLFGGEGHTHPVGVGHEHGAPLMGSIMVNREEREKRKKETSEEDLNY